MAKLDNIDLSKTKDPAEFIKYCAKFIQNLFSIFNGKIEFDSNILSQTIEVTFDSANTDTKVSHNLNRTGLGYIVKSKDAACDVYTGATAVTRKDIYLKSTVATTVTIILC